MRPIVLAAIGLIASPAALCAHARLLASTPAANATIAPTNSIRMHFSEALVEKLSGADLTMTGMAGTGMNVSAKVRLEPDGKSLALVMAKPLSPGTYKLAFHVTSTDTHRVTGGFAFRVR
ncbi:copper homeostasis periplasmic binding protein CopC [Sphingomonas bacterium]|uniref:copper homeostasis periplasmic binding protein CopC n=1 Tax=Sphingomonas bacterium TaxID=1895847 RepID=UPI0020C6D780|nr:copper homeostasis periplasmic binding protein CopC [Sphingomonas bacterium]